MKKIYLPIVLFSALSFAQEYKSINDSIYSIAVQEKEQGNFDKSIALLDKISFYSPEKNKAAIEKAEVLYDQKKYGEAEKILHAIDKAELSREELHNYYIYYGNTLDDGQKSKEAEATFTEGLKDFPNSYLLYYNLGISQIRNEKTKDAVENFQKSIEIYPYFSKAHYFLGLLALENGNLAEGTLATTTSVLLDNNGSITTTALQTLNKILSVKHEEPEQKFEIAGSAAFENIETIIRKQYALNKEYKLKSELDFEVVRQLQALISESSKISDRNGFFAKHYLDFYSKLWAENQFEDFTYTLFSKFDNDGIQKSIKKKESNIKKFVEWAAPELAATVLTVTQNGQKLYVVNDGQYIGYGNITNKSKEGKWTYNYYSGDLAAESNFKAGKKNGLNTFYFPNKKIANKINFQDDKYQGSAEYYYENGNIYLKKDYNQDVQVNAQDVYYLLGGLKCRTGVKNDKRDGKEICYYQNGAKMSEYNYINGDAEGKGEEYYTSGKLKSSYNYSKGLYNGDAKEFYPDGKTKSEVLYKNGEIVSDHKYYSPNGDLNYIIKIAKPNIAENIKSYVGKNMVEERLFENAINKGQINYILNKPTVEFTFSGKSGEEYITSYHTFDQDGKAQPEIKIEKEKPFVIKLANGNTYFSGNYNKNYKKQGNWKFYNIVNGILENETYYEDGEIDKVSKDYFPNGNLKTEVSYTKGKQNGPYKSYYANGNKSTVSNFVNGEENGDVTLYYENGKLKSNYFVEHDKANGKIHYFDLEGKLTEIATINDGETTITNYYNDGKIVSTLDYNKPGATSFKNKNDQEQTYGTLKNGIFEDSYYTKNLAGEKLFETNVKNGEKYGATISRNPNGTPNYKSNYISNQAYGLMQGYNIAGNLYYDAEYANNNSNGKFLKYLPNGKTFYESNYVEDKINGEEKYFGSNGEVLVTLTYANGTPVYYQTQNESTPTIIGSTKVEIRGNYKSGKEGIILSIENGEYNGPLKLLAENGNTLITAQYKDGFVNGERRFYDNDGKLYSIENFRNGDYNGLRQIFYPNGKPKIEAEYEQDFLQGIYKEYDESGKIIMQKTYNRDVLIQVN